MPDTEIETFYAPTKSKWRAWLHKNHRKKKAVWLIGYLAKSGTPSVSWSDSVDEALCYGWIDSRRKPLDANRYIQFFGPRKITGTWSKINKEKVERLIKEGLMQPAGLECIERAKKNGSWNMLDDVEALKIPTDLTKEFKNHRGSKPFFIGLSRSVKKAMLQWIMFAKRPETRQKRITEIASMAGQKLRPAQFR